MSDEVHIEFEPIERRPGERPPFAELFQRQPRRARVATTGSRAADRSTAGRVLMIGLASLLLLGVGAAVASLVSASSTPGLVDAGDIDDLRRERVTFVKDVPAFVVATPDAGFLVLHARSTHLRSLVVFCPSSGWFEDPAHGSKWDRMGHYTAGPAARGLDRFRSMVEDGRLLIDLTSMRDGPPRGTSSGQRPEGLFCT